MADDYWRREGAFFFSADDPYEAIGPFPVIFLRAYDEGDDSVAFDAASATRWTVQLCTTPDDDEEEEYDSREEAEREGKAIAAKLGCDCEEWG